jgi:putative tryptophan/tyrosine transport system substrate-binding protein
MQFDQLKRREFVTFLGGTIACAMGARAQQSERVRRIGVLMGLGEDDPETKLRLARLRQELGRLGWLEGGNLHMDIRFATAGTHAQALAKELVTLRPDVIVAHSAQAADALQRETRVVPIVFVNVSDPIGAGFVASLARPGGNLTGLLHYEEGIIGKWLALLKEIAPRLARVALVADPRSPVHDYFVRNADAAASSLAIELVPGLVENATDIERFLDTFARLPDGGLLLPPDITTITHRDLVVGLAARHRLPAMYSSRQFVAAGGLMSYGTDQFYMFGQTASYIDRILRGSQAADLPVQAPTKYETVLNLKTAKALGLTVSPGLLVAADEVIE